MDGDGDRCIMVDELGNVLDGDYMLAIAAMAMLKEGYTQGRHASSPR